jgi:phosphate transport system permease protein
MRESDRGAVGLFASGLGTLSVLVLLVLLLWIVAVNAFGWFWPGRIHELALTDGSTMVGQPSGREPAAKTRPSRIRLKVGNREFNQEDFIWVEETRIESTSQPPDLVRILRTKNGDAFGRVMAATSMDARELDASDQRSLRALVRRGSAARRLLDDLRQRHERLRRPLTDLEHRIDRLRRSYRADQPSTARTLKQLERDARNLAGRLQPELTALETEIGDLRERLARGRLVLDAGEEPVVVPLTQMVEVVWANEMNWLERVAYALTTGVKFLAEEPRAANTEGGIYPILFGTVLLVLLMSLAVMPLGVIAAVYLVEYATPGPLSRLARRAIHNLAGVPSIVFGMFGLAFFVYGLGGAVDRGFFSEDLPSPTFGTGGILWASLTLAVLTIPVVVVATTEGLQAVPRGWRDGSMALGATRWQTLRTIILPAAVPGMLTGLILAVGRAAGEVAPLMLTGAVKLAHGLPIDSEAPFMHLQRKFMHLGFHIYDISMQSPDVEATKPMAFASTVVLLGLVVAINLTAILIRRHLHSVYRVLEE